MAGRRGHSSGARGGVWRRSAGSQVYFDDTHAYVKKPLAEIAERLPRHLFFRASRQHVVNLNYIGSIEEAASGGYLVVLDNGKKLEISRRSAAALKETMSL